MTSVLPNLVYIGPDKAGSTWLFGLLSHHTEVFMTPAKDLYFFDRYYDKGIEWYARQFVEGAGRSVVGEISHDYLYDREAAQRMRDHIPDAKLIACLREPVQRTFSGYLHLVKSGQFSGTFEQALEKFPGIIERSRYGQHLQTFLEYFPPEQLYCAVFDDLQESPQRFADQLFEALDLPTMVLPSEIQQKSLPAGRSRSVLVTKAVRKIADAFRDAGLPEFVGRVKSSKFIQDMLYSRYSEGQKPKPAAATCRQLREVFAPDVAQLDQTLGTNVGVRWGYYAPPRRREVCATRGRKKQESRLRTMPELQVV